MLQTARNRSLINIDDDYDDDYDKQYKSLSTKIPHLPTESSLAPLVSFDEHGDIPFPVRNRSYSIPIPKQNPANNHCCYLCSWKRFQKDFGRLFIQFLFSPVGLFILVFAYTLFGAFLFYTIESKYEPRKNQQIKTKHLHGIHNIRHIVNDEFNWMLNASFELRYALWRGMLSRLDEYHDTGWRVQVHSERFDKLIDHELARMQAAQEKLADKQDTRSDAAFNQKWTFSTAVLYSSTVITTIGYGNITPKSILGKVITCLYGIIGIPIMIMYVNNTGDLFAFLFIKYYSVMSNFIYQLIRQRRRRRRLRHRKLSVKPENQNIQYHVPVIVTISVLILYLAAGAVLFSHWEGWSYIDGAYFSFITFTTIGLGDLVPGKGTLTDNKNGKSILCAFYLLFGLVLTAMCFKIMQDDLFSIKQKLYTRLGFKTYNHYRLSFNQQHRIYICENDM